MTQVISRRRSRVAAVVLLCCSLLLSGIATDHARAGETASDRAQMLRLTNRARENNDRDALVLNRTLSRYALRHSSRMAEEGELFHTKDLAAKLKGLHWSAGGENVGVASSLDDLQAAFMGSKPHRENILCEDYDHTAIGVVESDGSFWVTVIFYG
jgi:uncharacterized protein YkwD